MRWPTGALSLLGRACGLNPGHTYILLRLLREHSTDAYLRRLWQLNLDRRRETNDVAARGKVEWGEANRRLGTMGGDGRGTLMPSWSTILCEVDSEHLRGGYRAASASGE